MGKDERILFSPIRVPRAQFEADESGTRRLWGEERPGTVVMQCLLLAIYVRD
jgi:hypothetical protein